MEDLIREWIVNIINDNEDIIKVAAKQRAKFEGWLKFMLVREALKNGCEEVIVEDGYGRKKRADLSLKRNSVKHFIELKTINSSWGINGVLQKGKPITKNIDGISSDIEKLRSADGKGIVAFVFFPIPVNNDEWKYHIGRIEQDEKVNLINPPKYSIVPIGDDYTFLVFSFLVN